MAKQGKISSRPIKFFRVIWTTILESGELELPRPFVKMQGKNIPKFPCLKVPTGEETKMELKMSEGRAWLHKGWQEFVDKYSIQCGYFLNFQYHGGSRFDVVIFDMGCTEIKYPIISPSTRDKHEISEDDSDDKMSEECPQKVEKGKGVMKNTKQSRKLNIADGSERVLEKANSFHSRYPHFIITMKPTYVIGNAYLYVPLAPAKSCFPRSGNGSMIIHLNGKTWPMKYSVVASPPSVKIRVGWNEFAKDNNLKTGDVCAFELVNRKHREFNITIFRIANEEVVKTSAKKDTSGPKAMKRLLRRVESFKSDNPHFKLHMNSTYISWSGVNIPSAHAKEHLKEDDLGEKVIKLHGSNGRIWEVEYIHRLRSPGSSAKKVLLTTGWLDFVSDNDLNEEDIIIFERMNGETKDYKVTIFSLGCHA